MLSRALAHTLIHGKCLIYVSYCYKRLQSLFLGVEVWPWFYFRLCVTESALQTVISFHSQPLCPPLAGQIISLQAVARGKFHYARASQAPRCHSPAHSTPGLGAELFGWGPFVREAS